jgi:hypothetical protein
MAEEEEDDSFGLAYIGSNVEKIGNLPLDCEIFSTVEVKRRGLAIFYRLFVSLLREGIVISLTQLEVAFVRVQFIIFQGAGGLRHVGLDIGNGCSWKGCHFPDPNLERLFELRRAGLGRVPIFGQFFCQLLLLREDYFTSQSEQRGQLEWFVRR